MDFAITVTMILIYIAGLAIAVYGNLLPVNEFEEYATGGRSFGWPFVAMTIIGTFYSGSIFISSAQMGHDIGIVVTHMVYYGIGSLFILYLIAGPLWKLGKKYSLKSMGQFLELRFGGKPIRVFTGFVGILIEFPWVITEFLAVGYAIQAVTYHKVPFNIGMIIMAMFITAYIIFAGARSVVIADYYQGWMYVLTGFTVIMVCVYKFFGGFGPMFMQVRDISAELLTLPGANPGWGGAAPGSLFWPSMIISGIVGGFMWPSLFSRIFTASSTKELKEGNRVAVFVATLFLLLLCFLGIGTVARPEFNKGDTAYVVINMISSLGPIAVAAISILILAGSLNMMDAMISSWSVVFTNDVLTPFFPKIKSKKQTSISRLFVLVVVIVALIIASRPLPTIIQIINRMYQGIIQFFPAVFLSLYWKKGSKISAWGGILSGLAVTAYYAFTAPDYIPQFGGLQGGTVALGVNIVVYVVLALITKPAKNSEKLYAEMRVPDKDIIPVKIEN